MLTRYRYRGPSSAVTLIVAASLAAALPGRSPDADAVADAARAAGGGEDLPVPHDVVLSEGAEVVLPTEHPFVDALVARRHLIPLEPVDLPTSGAAAGEAVARAAPVGAGAGTSAPSTGFASTTDRAVASSARVPA